MIGQIKVSTDSNSPRDWRVEHIDCDGDGGIDVAIFSGPNAEANAHLFATVLIERGGLD